MIGFKKLLEGTVEVDFKLWGEFENCSGLDIDQYSEKHIMGKIYIRTADNGTTH